jgi:hypothetical protein
MIDLQLWVALVIPLGVLAASDAARAGRRGWLALLIALLVIAPIAFWIGPLIFYLPLSLIPPCLPNAACPPGPRGAAPLVVPAGWTVTFLPVPLAALVYSLTSARSAAEYAPAATETDQSERRALIICAIAGIVVMSALDYPKASQFLFVQFGLSSLPTIAAVANRQILLLTLWPALAALPVAIASMAMAHAAQTGRRGWLAGWIALIPLALLSASLGFPGTESLILAATGIISLIPFEAQFLAVSIAAPVASMLVALLYALTVMRPRRLAAGITDA